MCTSENKCQHPCHWCWHNRCVNTSSGHYGEDVSGITKCDSFITSAAYRQLKKPMDIDRSMELLNAMIQHMHVAESNTNVIRTLLNIGFTEEELVYEFNYSEDDVRDVIEEMEEEHGETE